MAEQRKKLTRMRRQIGDNLRQSDQRNPKISTFGLCDFTELLEMKAEYRAREQKISDTAFFIKAAALALAEFPALNSRLEGDEIITYDELNPGFAVDTPRGLIVLVLQDVRDRSLPEIAQQVSDTLRRLKEGALTLDDYKGSTFTISSMSKAGFGSFATSIINNDECVIIGFGGIHKGVFAGENDVPVVRDACYMTVNFNHAIVDGLIATQFAARLKQILESPKQYMQ